MSVTMKDLLSTELFKDAVVVAGTKGLDNEIKRINFTDCPMPDDDAVNISLIEKGDLFINSLYVVKEDENLLYEFIKTYISFRCAGTIIITEYIHELPQKVIALCNENNFPVVFIDSNIPYAEIIKITMEMILADKSDTISEMRIEKLLDNSINRKTVIELANELNKNFKKSYISVYIKFLASSNIKAKQLLISNIKKLDNIETLNFRNGLFLIINYDKLYTLDSDIDNLERLVKKYYENYNIGISNVFSEADKFNVCIRQALLSSDISNVIDSSVVYYKDINVYKILYPLKGSDSLEDFYNEVMKPLLDYDNHYDKFELIKTIEAYLNNDGDYKKTALYLNQHENTVRYRILKAKRILNLENNTFRFIEQVSIALKIKNILNIKI